MRAKINRVTLNLTVPIDLKRKLAEVAEEQERSISSLVEEAVNEYFARRIPGYRSPE